VGVVDQRPDPSAEIRTFLIADVRGYTLFTQERGDEVAAKLAAKFARLARGAVEGRGGSVIELRGDEVLAAFSSPRQALRAAVELQTRCVDETVADPSLPLPVGIGLDAGEAVAVEGGYRGGALNLAARLCGQAGPGVVLASPEVVHLARKVEGLKYLDGGTLNLKGLRSPVRVMRVLPEADEDPAKRLSSAALEPVRGPQRGFFRHAGRSRRWLGVGLAAVLLISTISVSGVLLIRWLRAARPSSGRPIALPFPSGVGLIDARMNRLSAVQQIPIQAPPSDIAVGYGAVWVTSSATGDVYEIDSDSAFITRVYHVENADQITVGEGRVWIAADDPLSLCSINVRTHSLSPKLDLGYPESTVRGLAAGHGALWLTQGSALLRIDPSTLNVERIDLESPTSVAVGRDRVWVLNGLNGGLWEVDPQNAQHPSYRSGNWGD
jgi:class 3 adenylate cyclase